MTNLINSSRTRKDSDFLFKELLSYSNPLEYYNALYYCQSLSDLTDADGETIFVLEKLKDFFISIYLEYEQNEQGKVKKELSKLCKTLDVDLLETDNTLSLVRKLKNRIKECKQLST